MNGALRICDTLLALGVDVCFANPGTSEMHLVAALDQRPGLRCVLGLAETVVTGAADGYARMCGRPAVTLLHLGPGLANGLANLHNARRAHSPVINLVGDHASWHLAEDPLLATDIESLARPMSAWVGRVGAIDAITPQVLEAHRVAVTTPGVATLILPADMAWSGCDAQAVPALPVPAPRRCPDGQALASAASALRSGRRCGLLIGGSALRGAALAKAAAISEATGATLIAPTSNARIERGGGRPRVAKIPYWVDEARAFLRVFDALIVVGASPPVAFFAYPDQVDPLYRSDCAVHRLAAPGDDLDRTLDALSTLVAGTARASLAPSAGAARGGAEMARARASGRLTDDALAARLAAAIPPDAIVCDEAITSLANFYAWSHAAPEHDYLQLTGGAIGIGIPLATGAALAAPGRKVITLQADGSGMYSLQGLWTQAREQLDVVTVVLANQAYATLRRELRNVGVVDVGRNADAMVRLDRPSLDWVSLARGMGVPGGSATTGEEFDRLLVGALAGHGPFLIEALIAPSTGGG
jgi:acetolactate synthase I/II/III large subunit